MLQQLMQTEQSNAKIKSESINVFQWKHIEFKKDAIIHLFIYLSCCFGIYMIK